MLIPHFCKRSQRKLLMVIKDLLLTFQATMLKKRKHKMKRRNTEPHMQLPLASTTGSSTCHVPNSAPPVGHVAVAASSQVPTRNLVDLCDSPTHATPV